MSTNANELLIALKGVEYGSQLRRTKFVVDSEGKLTYMGIAPRGSSSTEARWVVHKFVYSGSDLTDVLPSLPNQIFDNYASLEYAA